MLAPKRVRGMAYIRQKCKLQLLLYQMEYNRLVMIICTHKAGLCLLISYCIKVHLTPNTISAKMQT